MRLPKRGERGFTLIELLIVVAILGVLAAVVIPNVTRFFGKGEEEAGRTELHNVQLAVTNLMVDNGISEIPNPEATETNIMSAFPDATTLAVDKGTSFVLFGGDQPGYVLYGNQVIVDHNGNGEVDTTEEPTDPQDGVKLVNYVNMATTAYSYRCDADGTVHQYVDGLKITY
ncbi:hypothetical protein ES703_109097 [subsurface metagenome]